MRPKLRLILVSILLITTLTAWGQGASLRRANSLFNRGEYFAALQIYNQLISEGHQLDIPTQIKTGHCYYNLNNIDRAFDTFASLEEHLSGHDLFVYASTTQKFGFYSGAIELYRRVRPQLPNMHGHIDEMIRACLWAERNQSTIRDYLVNPLDITTYGQSFGIQFFHDGVVYSSASPDHDSKQRDKQGMNFLSLFYSEYKDGLVTGKRSFSENLVSPYHVGATSFTYDFRTMYFTRVVRVRGGNNILKIYSVVFDGKDWSDELELNFNSNEFDNAHPAVSPDGKFLYFTSNRPGGYGGKDLYVVERKPGRIYGTPRNLGIRINTFGDEQWPFISVDGSLYFSSNGHLGFGGLDLFMSQVINGEFGIPENMMFPFNTAKDDFGYVSNPLNPGQGFISSNRTSDGSIDAIFFVLPRVDEPVIEPDVMPVVESVVQPAVSVDPTVNLVIYPRSLNTIITSTFNGDPVSGAQVVIRDAFTASTVSEGLSAQGGRVTMNLPDNLRKEGQEFEIIVSKGSEFIEKRFLANILELDEIGRAGIAITPVFKEVSLNEIGEMIIPYIGNEITSEGYKVLDHLASILLNNKHVVIKLNALTEARGNRLNNLETSRTVSSVAEQYLVKKGVSPDNIIPRGYGERYLRNRCGRGIICTEDQHLENRRVEAVVWRFIR